MALFFASFHPPKSWKNGYVPPVLLLPRPRARVPLHARKSDAARSKLLFRPRGMRRPDRVHQPHHLRHEPPGPSNPSSPHKPHSPTPPAPHSSTPLPPAIRPPKHGSCPTHPTPTPRATTPKSAP